ncbi:hypothetical protein PVAND_007867 [Polypedilum vanderplanki]|uniref:Transposase domain-containing protein n=1 Tax=Polypedilum vanderplanki TaxID=319348 RepID=A0A9J6C950_POLVA|nr:hypothetical protein PVAND_007867 [Polypedilum vanderplanki]
MKHRKLLTDLSRKGIQKRFNLKSAKNIKVTILNNEIKEIELNVEKDSFEKISFESDIVNLPTSENKEVLSDDNEFEKIKNLIKINEDPSVSEYVKKELHKITCAFNLSRTGLNAILKLFSPFFQHLPKDYRSVLSTPRTTIQKQIAEGNYVHFGFEDNIKKVIRSLNDEQRLKLNNQLKVDIFVDGVSFFKVSLKPSYWIILGRIACFKNTIFPIGLYNGRKKPVDFDNFLSDVLNELKKLKESHLIVDFSECLITRIRFLLDTPARADVCGIAHHSAKFSCPKCTIEGEFDQNRLIFDEFNNERRTDNSFRERQNELFHKRDCAIESILEIDMIKSFPLCFLHKGNELRIFLLKIGPIVLKRNVPPEMYNNFLLLSAAFNLLCDKKLCIEKNKLANNLILAFLEDADGIYGRSFYTPMVHQLSHMADEVLINNQPCDDFSTFEFESYLTPIRKLLHTSNEPLSQIHRRIQEYLNSPKISDTLLNKNNIIYKKKIDDFSEIESVTIQNFKLDSCSTRDRFILTKNKKVCVILKIYKDGPFPKFLCRELKQIGEFFDNPIKATKLNFFWCKCAYNDKKKIVLFKEIDRKLIAMTLENEMFFAPFQSFDHDGNQ